MQVESIKRIDDVDPAQFVVGDDHILTHIYAIHHVKATLTSAAAATAINLLADIKVPAGKKAYLQNFIARVNGATAWATTTTVKIQDTNSSAIDFVTFAVAALTANARLVPGTADATLEDAFCLGTGGTAAKGLQLKGNANGTGSDLVVIATIVVK